MEDYNGKYGHGKVEHEGITYHLTEEAYTESAASHPGDWSNVDYGEECFIQFQAPAVDEDGKEYEVIWRFDVIKGEEPEDGGEYDWDDPGNIVSVERQ